MQDLSENDRERKKVQEVLVKIRPEEISSVIREQIKNYVTKLETADVGTVIQVADGVARIYGLEKAMQGELLEFPGEVYGMVMNCLLYTSDAADEL